jgi:hypothetical protein
MNFRFINIGILSYVLLGCSSTYIPPTSGEVVKLELPKLSSGSYRNLGIEVNELDQEGCTGVNIKKIDVRLANEEGYIYLKAETDYFLAIGDIDKGLLVSNRCSVTGWVNFKADQHYKLHYLRGEDICKSGIENTLTNQMVLFKKIKPTGLLKLCKE